MSPPVSLYLGVMPLSRINLHDTGEKTRAVILGGAVTAVAFVWNVFLKAEKNLPSYQISKHLCGEIKKKTKKGREGATGTG